MWYTRQLQLYVKLEAMMNKQYNTNPLRLNELRAYRNNADIPIYLPFEFLGLPKIHIIYSKSSVCAKYIFTQLYNILNL